MARKQSKLQIALDGLYAIKNGSTHLGRCAPKHVAEAVLAKIEQRTTEQRRRRSLRKVEDLYDLGEREL